MGLRMKDMSCMKFTTLFQRLRPMEMMLRLISLGGIFHFSLYTTPHLLISSLVTLNWRME
jgi:hypothetical protein